MAVSDELKKFAFGRCVIENNINTLAVLLKIIEEENISKIIIGLPVKLNFSKTHVTDDVINFANAFRNFLVSQNKLIEIILLDERLTSKLAEYHIRNSGLKKSKRRDKNLVDLISAEILLQNYLDSQK